MESDERENAIGRYRILDNEAPQDRQFLVIEDTDRGPVVWAGPFDTIWAARDSMRALAAHDEAADEQPAKRRRQDHRNDGDDHDGKDKPSPRKAIGCHR